MRWASPRWSGKARIDFDRYTNPDLSPVMSPPTEGDEVLQIERVQRAPKRVRRRGEFKAHERATRLEHAVHLRERTRAVGHVANPVGHGDDVVAFVGIGDVLSVDHVEIDGHAVEIAASLVHSRDLEHFGDEVGALYVARMVHARDPA